MWNGRQNSDYNENLKPIIKGYINKQTRQCIQNEITYMYDVAQLSTYKILTIDKFNTRWTTCNIIFTTQNDFLSIKSEFPQINSTMKPLKIYPLLPYVSLLYFSKQETLHLIEWEMQTASYI